MRNCLILGSARSGTSMVTGLLDAAGYNTGDNYLVPRAANPAGFFEDETVNRLNDRLLGDFMPKRYHWRMRKGLVPQRVWRSGPGFLAVVPRAATFTGEDESIRALVSRTPFAYKDPRLCWTLDAWRPHLPPDTAFLCMFREPGRTVASTLGLRDVQWYVDIGLDRRWALDSWISAYTHVLERHRQHGDWLFLHYDQVLNGDGVSRLETFLDVGLDVDTRRVDLRRSPDDGLRSRRASRIYDALLRCAN